MLVGNVILPIYDSVHTFPSLGSGTYIARIPLERIHHSHVVAEARIPFLIARCALMIATVSVSLSWFFRHMVLHGRLTKRIYIDISHVHVVITILATSARIISPVMHPFNQKVDSGSRRDRHTAGINQLC
jgi:hypothetical protein